jgi:hypothetical protein
MRLSEGQTGACHAGGEDIVYPEINTCMTLTVVYKDPAYVIGGHFSRPVAGMQSVASLQVVQNMRSKQALIGTVSSIFLIGARGVWGATEMQPIYAFIGELDGEFDKLQEFDTTSWQSVNITFGHLGNIVVAPTASGHVGQGQPPTQWP